MSTGDQSQYIRSKLAERGSRTGAKFMEDGFDRWAESEAPAREGQMEKIPAEHKMESYGGAMSLKLARRKLGLDMHGGVVHRLRMDDSKAYDDGVAYRLRMDDAMDMHGGGVPSVNELVDVVKKLLNFWRSASQWIDDFEVELTDEIIENPDIKNQTLKDVAKTLKSKLMLIKTAKGVLDQVASLAQSVGLGRHRRLHGGVSLSDIAELAKKYGEPIVSAYMWLKNNKPQMEAIMKMRSLQPYGQKILDAVSPILGAVGLGRHGMGGKRHCQCHHGGSELEDSEYSDSMMGGRRRHGGAPLKMRDSSYVDEYSHKLALPLEGLGGRRHRVGGMFKVPAKTGMMPRTGIVGEMHELKMGGRRRRVGGRAPSARGEIVKKVMREQGLSLPQASSYVKQHGLY